MATSNSNPMVISHNNHSKQPVTTLHNHPLELFYKHNHLVTFLNMNSINLILLLIDSLKNPMDSQKSILLPNNNPNHKTINLVMGMFNNRM